MRYWVIFLVLVNSINGLAHSERDKKFDNNFFVTYAKSNEIKVMTYNVENLYNAKYDGIPSDFSFLPKDHPLKQDYCAKEPEKYKKDCLSLDWTDEKYQMKLSQIAEVVKAQGSMPDLLATVEIENESVALDLAKIIGFKSALATKNNHFRSQNEALLFNEDKLELLSKYEVKAQPSNAQSRNILIVHFKIKSTQEILGVYVNHWMALPAPKEWRKENAKVVAAEVLKNKSNYKSYHYMLVGDFNTPDDEIKELLSNELTGMTKLDFLAFKDNKLAQENPDGSYYDVKHKEWNHFDGAILSPSLIDNFGTDIKLENYRLVFFDYMQRLFTFKDGSPSVLIPKRYNYDSLKKDELGYSDHLPTVFTISL